MNASKTVQTIEPVVKGRSLWQDAWRRFRRNKAAIASGVVLLLITAFVIVAPMLSSFGYADTDWSNMGIAPSMQTKHYFGTDILGRDLLVRTAVGGQISLMVGIAGALVAVLVGTVYGAVSGFLGGKVDMVMMRFLEILSAFPFMFFVILLVTLFGRNIILIFVAIGLVSWLNKEFIEAARVTGVTNWQIVIRHIVPNVLGVVVIYASLIVPGMILFESFLSFLGLGVQEPRTSWGALLQEGAQTMQVAPWQLLVPSTFLVITLFCFNFIGDGLRDALDPKDR